MNGYATGDAGAELPSLDPEAILSALDPAVRARVQSMTVDFETKSTQLRALDVVPRPRSSAIFLAERQTGGQGRRGRSWVSPLAANLYMSVSRRFDAGLPALAGLSLVVGVAIAEALRAKGFSGVGVKWPNDLVVADRKLGGILIQLRTLADRGTQAVVGIGINVRMPAGAATEIDQPWCDLSQMSDSLAPRNELAAALLDGVLPALDEFEDHGLAPFQERWARLDALLGKPVRLLDGAREIHGTSLGIADSGALRIRDGEREHLFHGGEVSLRPA